MTINYISKVIQQLILITLFSLVGCNGPIPFASTTKSPAITSSSNNETQPASSILITPIALTPLPTIESTSTVTPTPSPTLLATLSPDASQEEVARLMQTNDSCSGVCFWGMYPGINSFDQAVRFLETFRENGREGTIGSESYFNQTLYFKDGELRVVLVINGSNGIVQSIGVGLDKLQAPYVIAKDWQAFRPDGILKAFGIPKQVNIIMFQGPEGRISYTMTLLYDQMNIEYSGNQVMILPQRIMHACPLVDQNIEEFDMTLGKYDQKIWNDGVDITRFTSLTMDSFYNLFISGSPKACIDLDYQKFSSVAP